MPFVPQMFSKLDPFPEEKFRDPSERTPQGRHYSEGPSARADRRFDMVLAWRPKHEVWALQYGALGLGVLNTLTAAPIIRHFRQLLRNGPKGIIMQTLACIILPASVGATGQFIVITRSLLASRYPPCPICWELRSALAQFLGGVFFPALTAPIISSMIAAIHTTEALPPLQRNNVSNIVKFHRGLMSPLLNKLVMLTCLQAAAGMVVVYFQFEQLKLIRQKEAAMVSDEQFNIYGEHGALGPGVTVNSEGVPTKYVVRKGLGLT